MRAMRPQKKGDLAKAMLTKRMAELRRLSAGSLVGDRKAEPVYTNTRPGRNELCPCGSGRKFKKCCIGQEE